MKQTANRGRSGDRSRFVGGQQAILADARVALQTQRGRVQRDAIGHCRGLVDVVFVVVPAAVGSGDGRWL